MCYCYSPKNPLFILFQHDCLLWVKIKHIDTNSAVSDKIYIVETGMFRRFDSDLCRCQTDITTMD